MRKVIFVIFSVSFGVVTLVAMCGAGYTIYKIVTLPWFWKLGLVFAVFLLALYFKRKT